jgi:hypothetical protein
VGIVLKPSNIELKFTATVVACKPALANAGGGYWMRIEIENEEKPYCTGTVDTAHSTETKCKYRQVTVITTT